MFPDIKTLFSNVRAIVTKELAPALRQITDTLVDTVKPDPQRVSGADYHGAYAALKAEERAYLSKPVNGESVFVWAASAPKERMYTQTADGLGPIVDGRRIRIESREAFAQSHDPISIMNPGDKIVVRRERLNSARDGSNRKQTHYVM